MNTMNGRLRLALPALAIDDAWRHRALDLWDRHFGAPAWIALALLAAFALVQWQVRPAQERTRAALVLQAEQAVAQRRAGAEAKRPRDPLSEALPDVATRGKDIGALLAAAAQSELVVERADYTVESITGVPLSKLHANLPVTGSYANVRRFIAEVLNAMPNATLESIQLERADTQSARLQATLRIVLFYRTAR
jgi:hypothetical protein